MVSEERIRQLCVRAIAARNTDEMIPILCELRTALHEHAEQLRTMLAEYPLLPVRSNPHQTV
jgi:hypothetical protein